jgi:hypothetical protein
VAINDGAVTLSGSQVSSHRTALSGFTAVDPPTGAKVTFVVGDGQSHTPEYAGLITTLLASNEFSGTEGDAWDTRTYDVSAVLPAGATSADAVLSTGSDSLVWVAAILSVPLTVPEPLAVTNLTADKLAPQPAGTSITFTASVTGGTGSYESRWYVWDGATWNYLRGWAAGLSYTWTPASGNADYVIAVHVRNAGEAWVSSSQRGLAFPITGAAGSLPPTVTAFTADKVAPQPAGTDIAFAATATGGSGSYESRWYVWDGVSWMLLRGWQAGLSYTWTPGFGDPDYVIAVHIRNAGEAWVASSQRGLAFPITEGP